MDKGAKFYRCDFQVHSPRDINWTGARFGVNAEQIANLSQIEKQEIEDNREQFCKEYLDKISNSGINAIAMTDHHDVVFVQHLRKVAKEQNEIHELMGEPEKMVTVFPGIELSLSNPASQVIIIFDADFEDTHLNSVLNFIGIQPTDKFDRQTVQTQRISQEVINNLSQLHKVLDEVNYCKGRYIVLPNVGKGGQHSIIRQGFQEHYIKMPCVGGYVDKEISQESGYQNKINGGDVNYGNKSIGLVSTSDNRYEDGREFGKYSTWVKWAEPTAEAIRQACLAKESRISQAEPEMPQIFIEAIDVTNSKFLGSFNIKFNQQYNALIGGRGTGKSTILEYIRWGLCDQTVKIGNYEELDIIQNRRDTLIRKTLTAVSGEVRITMVKNDVRHIVKRNSASREILLKIGDNEFQKVSEEDIRKVLPIQSYSQKQLSDVGVKTEELKRFIEQPIKSSLERISYNLDETNLKLKNSYNQLVRKKKVQNEIANFNIEGSSIKGQVKGIRESLKGISEVDQKTIDKKSRFELEKTIIENTESELTLFDSKTDELIKLLKLYPEPIEPFLDDVENKDLISKLDTEIKTKFKNINDAVQILKDVFSESGLKAYNEIVEEWENKETLFNSEYETAKGKSQSSQEQLSNIKKLENRLAEINSLVAERKSVIKELGNPENDYNTYKEEWKNLHIEKVGVLNDQATNFTDLSNNLIKAVVTKNINLANFKEKLRSILEGTRIREERIDALLENVRSKADPISEFISVSEELRLLAEFKLDEDNPEDLPLTPILDSTGFTEDHKLKIHSKISTDDWLQLTATELEFNPEFFYTTNNELGDEIPFRDASAGQQATALLTVLLNQPGMPLLLDQPEDDIDNRAIDSIIRNIWNAKKKRQLVFTSHNANLVVNGDAELVICCDYKDASSQTRGVIKAEGAIDAKEIKNEITSVMEGGEKAFRLRKDKYGF
ncbi:MULTISPECIES: TrlF family AAA-like ATPase [Flavobacteriaceae]|uniref:AAA family ATPase n=5 Tax=Flavobacteriaceae TaxID=49546 RepID=A0A850NGQ9_9FLAO|nr:AAA family ATPase [Allomuricauda chongwuensis]NVN17588.1 AAA family ATPase [Allomuricauda chongwuensis]